MKKLKTSMIILLVAITLISLGFCTKVLASGLPGDNARGEVPINEDPEENIQTSPEDTNLNIHEGDLYVAATKNEYVMDQYVDGNVFLFGKNIKVTGEINGSLFIFASGRVEIDKDAYVACHVFVFADDVVMNGIVLDVYSASQTLTTGKDAIIYRQMKAVAEEMTLAGSIGRDLSLVAKTIEIAEDGLHVYGDIEYQAGKELIHAERLELGGETKFKQIKEETQSVASIILDYVFGAVGTVVFDVLLYLALLFLAPKFIEKSKAYVSTKGLLAFAIGLAFTILVPILAFILILTGFLGGLGAFAIFAYGTVLMLNAFITVVVANEFLAEKLKIEDKFKKGLLLAGASLVIWLLRKIPILGGWISIIVFLYGIGVIILYQFDKRKNA